MGNGDMKKIEVTTEFIETAGAVLWTYGLDNQLLIALIHRPRYDDWSLPKGKVEKGESAISCAYREVMEETGFTGRFGPELGETVYDTEGSSKRVRYWSARASDAPTGEPNPVEVDEVRWLSPPEARALLTLIDDQSILDFFMEFGPETTPLVLLRHAKAVKRDEWDGDDDDRPLDQIGERQAKRMLPNFLPYGIVEIYSSEAIRCLETVEPLSRSLELKAVISQDLGEYLYVTNSDLSLSFAQDLISQGKPTIVCSHNPILPKLVKKLVGKKNFKELAGELNPCEAWVLHHRDGEIIAIDLVESPIL